MSAQQIGRFELCEQDIKRILHGFAVREQIIGLLCNAPRGDAVGAAAAFLIRVAEVDPGQLRAVLQQPWMDSDGRVVRVGDILSQFK